MIEAVYTKVILQAYPFAVMTVAGFLAYTLVNKPWLSETWMRRLLRVPEIAALVYLYAETGFKDAALDAWAEEFAHTMVQLFGSPGAMFVITTTLSAYFGVYFGVRIPIYLKAPERFAQRTQ